MEFIVIALLLVVAPLAYFFGADSRIDEVERRRNRQSLYDSR